MRVRLSHLAMLIVLTLVWVLVGWRLWTPNAQDRQMFLQNSDFTLHYYGPISQQIERFQHGEFAQWNPYNRAGFPQVANIQNGVFYPIRYGIASVIGASGWTIQDFQWEVMAHIGLTSILMYAFLCTVFHEARLRFGIGLFGALAWAYSGYMSSYPLLHVTILETVTWLPLALLGVTLCMTLPRWIWGAALTSVSIMLMVFAGHPQVMMYCVYLVGFYGLYIGRKNGLTWRVILIRGGLAMGLGVGLSAIQLAPTLELMRLSSRVVEQGFIEKSDGFDLTSFFSLIWSNGAGMWSPLYLGVTVILLAVAALSQPARKPLFWAGVAGICLLFTFGGQTIVYQAFYVFLPGISVFRNQERAVVILIFALVVLACEGLAWLTRAKESPEIRRFSQITTSSAILMGVIFLIIQVASSLGAAMPAEHAQAIALTVLIGIGFAVWVGFRLYTSPRGLAVLVVLVCVDLLTVGASTPSRVRDIPENHLRLDASLAPYRIPDPSEVMWRVDGSSGVQGTADYFRIPDIYGNGPFSIESVDKLYTLPVDRFWEIFSVRYATIIDPPPPTVSLDLLAYGRNQSGQEFQVVELLAPRPLAHLVYDYRMAEGSPEFARQIMADSDINLREQAITLYPLPFELPVTRPNLSIVSDVIWESPEHLTMTVSTGADALLTLSVVNYPGWQARIDDQPVEMVNVYAGLIGIPMRAGENQRVELVFESGSLRVGAVISLIAAVVLGGVLWWFGIRR